MFYNVYYIACQYKKTIKYRNREKICLGNDMDHFVYIFFIFTTEPGQKKDKLINNVIKWLPNEILNHNAKVLPKLSDKRMSHPSQGTCNVDDMKCPHPGLSYNPTIEDHTSLLSNIAEQETELIKHEAHINRVTQKLFKQVLQNKHEVIL